LKYLEEISLKEASLFHHRHDFREGDSLDAHERLDVQVHLARVSDAICGGRDYKTEQMLRIRLT
jgi:hypothetical protein